MSRFICSRGNSADAGRSRIANTANPLSSFTVAQPLAAIPAFNQLLARAISVKSIERRFGIGAQHRRARRRGNAPCRLGRG